MTDTLEGSTVSYTCNAGYMPDRDSQMTRRCMVVTNEGGNQVAMWTGEVPGCDRKCNLTVNMIKYIKTTTLLLCSY